MKANFTYQGDWSNWGTSPGPDDEWNMGAPRRPRLPWKMLLLLALGSLALFPVVRLLVSGSSPAAAARRYYAAATRWDGNQLARLTCAEQQTALMEAGLVAGALDIIARYYLGDGLDLVEIDIEDIRFETISESEQEAIVHVSGELRTAYLLLSLPVPVDENWRMVRENGRWKWCGVT